MHGSALLRVAPRMEAALTRVAKQCPNDSALQSPSPRHSFSFRIRRTGQAQHGLYCCWLMKGSGKQLEDSWKNNLQTAKRVVIKLGTSLLTSDTGGLNIELLKGIARDVATLQREGRQVVLVSSGAVGLGAFHLGLAGERRNDVVMKQACAAVGQSLLMASYEQLFAAHRVKIAQVLLTEDDFINWQRYQNLRSTMERLLKLGVLPIVNENDTVSIAELRSIGKNGQRVFSDNDRLAALVMSKLDANVLVLLTD